MRNLNWEMKQLCERHLDGAFATQAGRTRTLSSFATFLHDEGHTKLTLRGIKPAHIEAFVAHCQGKGLATGTLKNIMTHLRWIAEKIGKQNWWAICLMLQMRRQTTSQIRHRARNEKAYDHS